MLRLQCTAFQSVWIFYCRFCGDHKPYGGFPWQGGGDIKIIFHTDKEVQGAGGCFFCLHLYSLQGEVSSVLK